jgi:hypothetical protein
LRDYGELKQVEKEMTSYNLDIMGLIETKWKENGEIKTQNGNFLMFSGVGEDIEHRSGVGILMNKETRRILMELSPVSERIILAYFKTNICNLPIIKCYAPKQMTDKNMKETFYQHLHESITAIQKKGFNHSDGGYECQN